jgi:hypothetical protein
MDIALIIVIVLVVLAAVALLAVWGRQRRLEQQRREAAEHRHDAEIHAASAQRREAEAAERAARAEREQAQAREQAARARQDRETAQARRAAADRIDPDTDARDERRDAGATPNERPTVSTAAPDQPDRQVEARAGDRGRGPAEPTARTDELPLGERDGRGRGDPTARTDEVPTSGAGDGGPRRPGDTAVPAHAGGQSARREDSRAEDTARPEADRAGVDAPAGPERSRSASAGEVPQQRTRNPDEKEPDHPHPGRMRAMADRLLHRQG